MERRELPRTPRDLFRFRLKERLLIDGLIAFFRLTGLWRFPARASGDIETMTFMDKVYWLYKAVSPIRRARRGSGLEEYFREQSRASCALPAGLQVESEVTLSSAGDLINHPFLAGSSDSLYREVSDIVFGSDLPMANLECPIFPQADKEFVFSLQKAPPLYYDLANFSVSKGGHGKRFGFLATACNHSLDFGLEGVRSTISALDAEGIAFSGLNRDEEDASRATIVERKGLRIGIVAYTFGLNAYKPPEGRPNVVNRMRLNEGVAANDFRQLEWQLAYCREKGVDFVVAHLHWGLEHEFYPVPEQVELAHHLAEMGIDLIIGHHPHVVQPLELYRTRRDPARVVPVFYSLGNLINSFTAPYLTLSAVARVTLARGRLPDGTARTYVKSAVQTGIRQVVDEQKKQLRLVPATLSG